MDKHKIRSILVSENLDDRFGGPPKSVAYLCANLIKLGVDSQMMSVKLFSDEHNSVVAKYDLNWTAFPNKFSSALRYSPRMLQALEVQAGKDENVILHANNMWNYAPYAIFQQFKKSATNYIISTRGTLYPWSLKQSRIKKTLAWYYFQKEMLNKAACIHATEEKEVEAIRKLGIKSKIALISNGVELSEFNNLPEKRFSKESLGLDPDRHYILFLSRIHPKKGLEFLIEALCRHSQKYSDYDLLIAGPEEDADYVRRLKRIIETNNVIKRVRFMEMLHGQARIDAYNASELFVLPSHTENFGIVIAEAMAAGLPVITTTGTPWSALERYNAGWWIELNQENMNNTLFEALSVGNKILQKMGANAKKYVESYDWLTQADKMKRLYEHILFDSVKPEFVYE